MTAQHPQGPPTTPGTDDDRFRFYLRKLQRHPAYLNAKAKVRVVRRLLPDAWRMATNRSRQLPAALIVGAQKAGTTQLFAYLTRHPRCFGGNPKETRYFSTRLDRSLNWYRSRFPLAWRVAAVRGITIEASPSYLAMPQALRRMREVLPDARVIVLLRDPVERAFSHYQHDRTRHREPRSFAAAIHGAIEQRAYVPRPGAALRPDATPMIDYVSRGYYALQLDVLWNEYPREQVLIVDSADLFDDTNAVCQQVFHFLGLNRFDVHPDKVYNRGHYREKIDPATAGLLRDHYRPYDQLLLEMVGRPFRWMQPADRPILTLPHATSTRLAA